MSAIQQKATFREVLAVGEFRALWLAEAGSQFGDQLLRVALALLVYQRSDSPLLTTVTYALTYLPTLVGGALLSGLADRYPRRTVMIICDLARGVLVALMAVPSTSTWLLFVLLTVTILVGGPFRAAFLALLADVLHGPPYVTALAIRNVTVQAAQLAGFALGGVFVAWTGTSLGFLLDAVTFLLSAALVVLGVRQRPAANAGTRQNTLVQAAAGLRLCWHNQGLRALIGLSLLTGLYIAPEGLAAPYSRAIGQGDVAAGLLMAADPIGSVIAGVIVGKWVSTRWSTGHIGLITALTGLPLLAAIPLPNLALSMVAFGSCGFLATAFLIPMSAAIAHGAPAQQRAQVMGLYSTAVVTTQGAGILLAGVAADNLGTNWGIAVSGAAGTVLAIPLTLLWRRAFQAQPETWLGEESVSTT